ncbi:MAG: YitT family protein [Chitinophagaceae bacterium]
MRSSTSTATANFRSILFLAAGVSSAALGLKGFLLPSHFLDGGITGISLLLTRLTHIDLSILLLVFNLPFIFLAAKQVSKTFALKTGICILALVLLVHFINMPALTKDPLLIAVFGGFFVGAGIGLSMRGGGVVDGTEVLAVYVSRGSSLSVGDFIGLFNVALFAASALLINLEVALYSMLTYLAASKTVDFIITGIEEYIGITIISEFSDEVHSMIMNKLGRGVTVYTGEGGYGKQGLVRHSRKILFCVVTRLEVQKMLTEIQKIDDDAFVIQAPVADTRGGMIKKRPLH